MRKYGSCQAVINYIRPKVTVHKCTETIQGRKLYEEIRYTVWMVKNVNMNFTSQLGQIGLIGSAV